MGTLVIVGLLCGITGLLIVAVGQLKRISREERFEENRRLMRGTHKVRTGLPDTETQMKWNQAHEKSAPSFEEWEASLPPTLALSDEVDPDETLPLH